MALQSKISKGLIEFLRVTPFLKSREKNMKVIKYHLLSQISKAHKIYNLYIPDLLCKIHSIICLRNRRDTALLLNKCTLRKTRN